MAIVKLGDIPGNAHALEPPDAGPNPIPMTIAATIPVGSTVIVMGFCDKWEPVTGITDTKGNTTRSVRLTWRALRHASWQTRRSRRISSQEIRSESRCTAWYSYATVMAAWFSTCFFDKLAQVINAATVNATGGAIAPTTESELILGIFGGYKSFTGLTPTATQIATPGAGYANQTGMPRTTTVAGSERAIGADWEYKIGSGSTETATATMNVAADADQRGMTAAYRESRNTIAMML